MLQVPRNSVALQHTMYYLAKASGATLKVNIVYIEVQMWVVGSLNVFHVGGSPGKYTCLKLYVSVSSQTALIRINKLGRSVYFHTQWSVWQRLKGSQ